LRAISLNPDMLPALLVLASTYVLRGHHSHAAPLAQRAVDIECSGATHAFFGARIVRATLHLAAGETVAATRLLDDAIATYAVTDHVFAETLTAYAYVMRGCAAERTGAFVEARADFARACEIAEANPHRITIGAHWVKARYGLARVLQRTGEAEGAARMLAEGRALYDSRDRFVWTWFFGATDAEMLYEEASALATMGRDAEALAALEAAGEAGWADVPSLRSDAAFETLRDTPVMRRVTTIAAERVALPAPVGSGGLG
jgi:tetratricopeptide (TPR) repeat protein